MEGYGNARSPPAKSVAGSPAQRSPRSMTPVSSPSHTIRLAGCGSPWIHFGATDHGDAPRDAAHTRSSASRSTAAPASSSRWCMVSSCVSNGTSRNGRGVLGCLVVQCSQESAQRRSLAPQHHRIDEVTGSSFDPPRDGPGPGEQITWHADTQWRRYQQRQSRRKLCASAARFRSGAQPLLGVAVEPRGRRRVARCCCRIRRASSKCTVQQVGMLLTYQLFDERRVHLDFGVRPPHRTRL